MKSIGKHFYIMLMVVLLLLSGSIMNAKIEREKDALKSEILQLKIENAVMYSTKYEPEIITGDYTLFLYFPDGHIGYVHVTQYYPKDGLLHYAPIDRPEEVTDVPFTRATGHITGEKLWDYGYVEIPASEMFGVKD